MKPQLALKHAELSLLLFLVCSFEPVQRESFFSKRACLVEHECIYTATYVHTRRRVALDSPSTFETLKRITATDLERCRYLRRHCN